MISFRKSDLIDRFKTPIGVINFYNPGSDYVTVENMVISEDEKVDAKAKKALDHSGFITNDENNYFYVCDPNEPGIPSPAELISTVYIILENWGFNCNLLNQGIDEVGGKASIEIRR